MFKHICSFFLLLATALLPCTYFITAGGHDGESTSIRRLIASYEGDYCPLSDAEAQADSLFAQVASGAGRISPYDEVMRQEGAREGYDWRLLSAIAYHESRFTPTIVSRRGAAGLMQVMPSTARQFDVPQERMLEPRTNIRLAAKLLRQIERSLRFGVGTPASDRMSIVLACYNGGIGHVLDARRLAVKYGANPNRWEDVSTYLRMKGEPEIQNDEAIECGRFAGSGETLAFVNDVMNRYALYCHRAESS